MNTTPPAGIETEPSIPHGGNILSQLRNMLPRRTSIATHSQRYYAELQANTLLRLSGVQTPPVPDNIIGAVPNIDVEYAKGLPMSGAATWTGQRWLISIAADDPEPRQRFTLAHEFKHILDHRDFDNLHHDRTSVSAQDHAETLADHFAICLLMPRHWVTQIWQDEEPTEDDIARLFNVRPRTATRRLWQLGMTPCGPTCNFIPPTTYRRARRPHQKEPA